MVGRQKGGLVGRKSNVQPCLHHILVTQQGNLHGDVSMTPQSPPLQKWTKPHSIHPRCFKPSKCRVVSPH
ncbi:hypothetical protein RMSM_02140 [Rhodopirellula maiorica SM1]|uniref:Uncharacterized protein n=1 Tax=Rhodopirellula maiorica SM1 TaxID=1265738 RepID=M5RNM6_9BACT|nr:hypothetical protein RMSM_02140 [Rhodopirellula maiorica SM1]